MDVDLDNKEVRWKIEESNEKKTLLNLTTGSGGTGYDLNASPMRKRSRPCFDTTSNVGFGIAKCRGKVSVQ